MLRLFSKLKGTMAPGPAGQPEAPAAGDAQASGADRRRHERQLVSIEAEITQPTIGQVRVYTRDLSRGGAFVLLAAELCPPVGSAVILRLKSDPWGGKLSTFNARVVRVTDQGMALQFFDFDTAY